MAKALDEDEQRVEALDLVRRLRESTRDAEGLGDDTVDEIERALGELEAG